MEGLLRASATHCPTANSRGPGARESRVDWWKGTGHGQCPVPGTETSEAKPCLLLENNPSLAQKLVKLSSLGATQGQIFQYLVIVVACGILHALFSWRLHGIGSPGQADPGDEVWHIGIMLNTPGTETLQHALEIIPGPRRSTAQCMVSQNGGQLVARAGIYFICEAVHSLRC